MSINERPLLERLQRAANAGGYYSDWVQEGHDRIVKLEKALRWCVDEQAYWHAGLKFFTNGEDTIEAPEDIRQTFLSLMVSE